MPYPSTELYPSPSLLPGAGAIAVNKSAYQFVLSASRDLSDIADLTNVARNKQLDVAFNRAGSAQFTVPLDDDVAGQIAPVNTCIRVLKNGEIVWSGPVWSTSADLANNRLAVTALGWLSLLDKRILNEHNVTYATNGGAIAHGLLAKANAVQPTWITKGSNTDTAKRNRTYARYVRIGEEIKKLSEIESGYDMYVDPATRMLHIAGYTAPPDRTNVIFGFGWGPNNVQQLTRTEDADSMANKIYVTGKYGAQFDLVQVDASNYQLFEEVRSLSDVADPTILQAYADVETLVHSRPKITYSMVPFPENASENVPSMFEDYELGDKVYLTARRGAIEITGQAIRVFGVTIGIDDEGNEKISQIKVTDG